MSGENGDFPFLSLRTITISVSIIGIAAIKSTDVGWIYGSALIDKIAIINPIVSEPLSPIKIFKVMISSSILQQNIVTM